MSNTDISSPEPLDAFPCLVCDHPSRFHKRDAPKTAGRDDPYPCHHEHCTCPQFARPPGYMAALTGAVSAALGVPVRAAASGETT